MYTFVLISIEDETPCYWTCKAAPTLLQAVGANPLASGRALGTASWLAHQESTFHYPPKSNMGSHGMCKSEHWDPAGFLLDILNHVLDIFIIVQDISYFITISIAFVSYNSRWISLHPFPTLPPTETVVGPPQFFAEESGGRGENQSGSWAVNWVRRAVGDLTKWKATTPPVFFKPGWKIPNLNWTST